MLEITDTKIPKKSVKPNVGIEKRILKKYRSLITNGVTRILRKNGNGFASGRNRIATNIMKMHENTILKILGFALVCQLVEVYINQFGLAKMGDHGNLLLDIRLTN